MLLPQVTIEYCAKCKWQQRAVWYLQELLQTFDGSIGAITLVPVYDSPGVFGVYLTTDTDTKKPLYKRKFNKPELAAKYGETMTEPYWHLGFPDAKFLKQLIKNEIGAQVGHHISLYPTTGLTTGTEKKETEGQACVAGSDKAGACVAGSAKAEACKDCVANE